MSNGKKKMIGSCENFCPFFIFNLLHLVMIKVEKQFVLVEELYYIKLTGILSIVIIIIKL